MIKINDGLIIIRGGGDLATGTIHCLFKCGFKVLVLEAEKPTAIRRQAAFSEAVYDGSTIVEGVSCQRADTLDEIESCWAAGRVPVTVDTSGRWIDTLKPRVVVDAIIAKRNVGTTAGMAPLVIGLGPGFEAGKDVHLVIETMRGHKLGRIIQSGSAIPNTGIPGVVGGYAQERVIHAPAAGVMRNAAKIGSIVSEREIIAYIDEEPVYATLDGVLRGLLRTGLSVTKGFKIADIDPRLTEQENCTTISDKARTIAGGVLQAIIMYGGN